MNLLKCPYFECGSCRSCSLLGEREENPHARKERLFSALIALELGDDVQVAPLWRPSKVFPSRTKAKLSVTGTTAAPVIGLVGTQESGFLASELLNCPLHLPQINSALTTIKGLISKFALTPYDVLKREGELKGLILKTNEDGTEILCRFVLRSRNLLEKVRSAVSELQNLHPEIKVISVNLQPVPHAVLEGEVEILLSELGFLQERFDSFVLTFAPQSFSQVTHETARALYEQVATILRKQPADGLLDLYCGVGGFSFAAAPHVKWSHGLELSCQAIACAKMSAGPNGAAHAVFEDGDVELYLKSYASKVPEVILVNPPRRGLSISILQSITRIAPSRVLYSSCNPSTLVRDLKVLAKDYEVLSIAPFDMFPLTEHLEAVALLKRRQQS